MNRIALKSRIVSKCFAIALVLISALLFSSSANAVSFRFAGTIAGGDRLALESIPIGTPWSLDIEFDESMAPTNESPGYAAYLPIDAQAVRLGGVSLSPVGGSGAIQVRDGSRDMVDFGGGVTGTVAGSVMAAGYFIILAGESTIFDGTALPSTLDLSDFGIEASITFDTVDYTLMYPNEIVFGNVESITVIPEPGTAVLVGLGLGMVASSRRRLPGR